MVKSLPHFNFLPRRVGAVGVFKGKVTRTLAEVNVLCLSFILDNGEAFLALCHNPTCSKKKTQLPKQSNDQSLANILH